MIKRLMMTERAHFIFNSALPANVDRLPCLIFSITHLVRLNLNVVVVLLIAGNGIPVDRH